MTTRDVALREQDRAVLVVPRTDSWMAVVEDVAVLAQRISGTELVPAALRGKAPAIAASILYGREIGLPPMTALRSVYVVNGQVALKAEAMRGLILAAGHELVFTESTSARCVVKGRRKGTEEWSEPIAWTIDDARKANLLRPGSPWHTYPRAMLKARATAELARDLFADVISGFVALEEVDGADPETQHDGTETRTPKRTTRRRTESEATPDEPPPAKPSTGVPGFPSTQSHTVRTVGDDPLPLPDAPASAVTDDPRAAEVGTVPLPGEPGYEDDVVTPMTTPPADEVPPSTSDDGSPGGGSRDTSTWQTYPAQRTKLHAVLTDLGVGDREVRLALASLVIGRTLESSNDLTRGEASVLIDTLEKVAASQTMRDALTGVLRDDDPLGQLGAIAHRIGALAAIPQDDPWTTPDEDASSPEDPWPTTP